MVNFLKHFLLIICNTNNYIFFYFYDEGTGWHSECPPKNNMRLFFAVIIPDGVIGGNVGSAMKVHLKPAPHSQ